MGALTIGKLRTCRKCKAFVHENSLHDYCPACYKKVEDVFDQIRQYLREYPGATSFEIEQRLGIPMHVVNNFVKDGRLIEIDNPFLNLECVRCGCLLLSAHHKYCPTCELQMLRELQHAKADLEVSTAPKVRETGKMRFREFPR